MEPIIQHHGILGMRWGVRRERGSDGLVGSSKSTSAQRKELRDMEKKKKILSSPKLLAKNLDKFSKEEVDQAISRMRLNRDFRQLELSEIKAGSDYVNAYLALGTSAAAAYGLYKSPLGQAVSESIKKAWK